MLYFERSAWMKVGVSIIVTLFLVLVISVVNPRSAVAETQGPTDEEILLGLVYGHGAVAKELDIVQEKPEKVSVSDYEEAINSSVNSLLNDGAYNKKTAEALEQIRSDDPRIVENGIEDLGKVVLAQAEDNLSKDPELKREINSIKAGAKTEPQCGVGIVCVAYAAAAVHNTVVLTGLAAVVVGGALWAGVWKWVGKGSVDSSEISAEREFLIAEITKLD